MAKDQPPGMEISQSEDPMVLGSEGLAKAYGLTSMPMTVLIGREGKIALSHTRVVDRGDFEGHVRELLR